MPALPFRSALFVMMACLSALALTACRTRHADRSPPHHQDGTYRGVFIDKDSIQVNVEFTLRNNIVTAASYRLLYRDENFHLDTDREPYRSVIRQYRQVLDHLVGKDIETHLPDLYRPERIIDAEVDGYTRATVRSSKVLSAIRDALNRGVYAND